MVINSTGYQFLVSHPIGEDTLFSQFAKPSPQIEELSDSPRKSRDCARGAVQLKNFAKNAESILSQYSFYEVRRITEALRVSKYASENISANGPTYDQLKKIAHNVNAAFFHCSGNCVLISRVLLYNLSYNQNLSCVNTYPITIGVDEDVVELTLFGKNLDRFAQCYDWIVWSKGQGDEVNDKCMIDNVETKILDRFKKTNQRYYIVTFSGYAVPFLGRCSHSLNAVVLTQGAETKVQFVDAWRALRSMPTKIELARRTSQAVVCTIFCLS